MHDRANLFINRGSRFGHSILGLRVHSWNREVLAKIVGGTGVQEWLGYISALGISEMKGIKGKKQRQNQRKNSETWDWEIDI